MQNTIKEVMDFVLADYHPQPFLRKPRIKVDYAQLTETSLGAERQEVRGGVGMGVITTFDHSKTSRIRVSLPIVDLSLLAMISGDCVRKKIANLFKTENLYVSIDENGDHYVELKKLPIENSLYLNDLEERSSLGEALMLTENEEVGEYEYKIDTENPLKIILNKESHKVGDRLIACYHTQTKKRVTNLTINPKAFPKPISFYGDQIVRNAYTGLDEIQKIVGHKGRIDPNYTLTTGTDVAVLEFTIDLYAYVDPQTGCESYIDYYESEEDLNDDLCCESDPVPEGEEGNDNGEQGEVILDTAQVTNEGELLDAISNNQIKTIDIMNNFSVEAPIIINRPITINGNSNQITYVGALEEIEKSSVLQALDVSDVNIEEIELNGGDVGILVDGSHVTVKNITTDQHRLGGIEVIKDTGIDDPQLNVLGTNTHLDVSEQPTPAIWISGKTTNDDWVIGELDDYEIKEDLENNQLNFFQR